MPFPLPSQTGREVVTEIVNAQHLRMINEEEAVLDGFLFQDNIPVLEENYVQKMNGNNGFSKKRLFRKIASVPIVAHIDAERKGYNMSDPADVRRFLQENPDYMTVERIRSKGTRNYIVR